MKKTILITGGAGFIGSHVVRRFIRDYQQYDIVNLDNLTYAGNLENLRDVEKALITNSSGGILQTPCSLKNSLISIPFDAVIHLAAESHVDRSISGPMPFITTNITGTVNLLDAARKRWKGRSRAKGLSIIFPPTRYTDPWGKRACSPKRPPMIREAPIPRPKPLPIIW
jgi:dTDP-glucose 4,6-dehydratase